MPDLLYSPFPLPELLFYFKIDPEKSLKRVLSRGGNIEIYEKLDFQKKTAEAYDEVIKLYDGTEKGRGMTVIMVDAEKSIEEIAEFIWNCVKNLPIHKA